MKSAEEWHNEFEQANIADLIDQYGGLPGFIRAIQSDAIKAAAENISKFMPSDPSEAWDDGFLAGIECALEEISKLLPSKD